MSDRYREAVIAGAKAIGIQVDDELADGMSRHFALVVKWARRINLTTVTDPDAAAWRHGVDSLLFSTFVPPDATWETVDVGSGAGFPGIVLALARPKLAITLLEPIRKRASFLTVTLADLGLKRVRVVEGKLEGAAKKEPIMAPKERPLWPVDLIVSRATIPPLELIPLAATHLKPGGRIILTAGAHAADVEGLTESGDAVGFEYKERKRFELAGGETRVLDLLERR